VVLIGKAAERNWTAAAWRLERKYDRWRRRDKLDLSHSGAVGVITHQATPDEMAFFKDNFGVLFPDLKGQVMDEPEALPEDSEDGTLEDFLDDD
jgi:hypothetical protein